MGDSTLHSPGVRFLSSVTPNINEAEGIRDVTWVTVSFSVFNG